MKYRNVIFDLDGTLNDSGPGIIESAEYAFEHLDMNVPDTDALRVFVGPPLVDSFMSFGVDAEKVDEAVKLYRVHYNNENAKYECELYPGIEDLLSRLTETGIKLYVATSKPEKLAVDVLEHMHIDHYFTKIAGASFDNSRNTKIKVLQYLLEKTRLESAVMVGDTVFDVEGAIHEGLPCIGVSWGYGNIDEMKKTGAICIVHTADQLQRYLMD